MPITENMKQVRTILKADLATLRVSESEIRELVDTYYEMQKYRIALAHQASAAEEAETPAETVSYLRDTMVILEKSVVPVFTRYLSGDPLAEWCMAQKGLGPVLTAGLSAHIDLDRAPTYGSLWRFAGQDPTVNWGKGEKRPWNATLKTLCWKVGESFVKVSGYDDAFYGRLYAERKQAEVEWNEAGENEQAARQVLDDKPKHKQAKTYKKGKLPDSHVHARAKRWTVKLFLSHYHEVGFRIAGEELPDPYPITHQGHVHKIDPPGPKVW